MKSFRSSGQSSGAGKNSYQTVIPTRRPIVFFFVRFKRTLLTQYKPTLHLLTVGHLPEVKAGELQGRHFSCRKDTKNWRDLERDGVAKLTVKELKTARFESQACHGVVPSWAKRLWISFSVLEAASSLLHTLGSLIIVSDILTNFDSRFPLLLTWTQKQTQTYRQTETGRQAGRQASRKTAAQVAMLNSNDSGKLVKLWLSVQL